MKKTIKELKELISKITEKGYILDKESSSFSDYDLKDILKNNLKQHIRTEIKKYNILNLDINENLFNIEKKVFYNAYEKFKDLRDEEFIKKIVDNKRNYDIILKDFSELTEEIKNHFSQFDKEDKINEIIKSLYLNSEFFKMYNPSEKYSLQEIEDQFKKQNSKALNLSKSFTSYGSFYDYKFTEYFNNINLLLKYLYGIEEKPFNLKDINYKAPLKDFESGLNSTLENYKVKLYLNGKVLIDFKNKDHFNAIFERLLLKTMERYTETIYLNIDEIKKHPLKNESHFFIHNKTNAIYLKQKVNLYQLRDIQKTFKDILYTPRGKYYNEDITSYKAFYSDDKKRSFENDIFKDIDKRLIDYFNTKAKDYFKE